MATPTRPAGTKVFGRERDAFVPAIADLTAPKLTEITAASAIDLSCYFYNTTARPDVNQNRVTPPPRVCDTQQFERMGLAQWQGGDLRYAVDPQAAALSTGKKALEALPEGTTGFLVVRFGIAVATDFAVGQFVKIYPIEVGAQVDLPEGDGEAAEAAIKQAFAVTAQPTGYVALVA